MIKNFAKYIQKTTNFTRNHNKFQDSFRKSKNRNFKQLAMIIKKDKFFISDILKVIDFKYLVF